uniref:Protein kinase domain-containing protein n=1 Tax=Chromera velia CCMP2878 TaxID=1169474 RepID=A0A0G4FL65_9ALVE|eukprot:Cvel_17587.t1-p1 / transcript=Cvel_17587.t1 / gene=Cvel_17587 / organism=Chromera_velia_CCMP2878 / gene_product=hypothetical protein / transcript_product=hypothetical protein / location=Cvel_scaffold1414:9239-11620(-) / protein_length=383 / sequence_SO=supercontig / SO=protein_coding / is_pseudo=false
MGRLFAQNPNLWQRLPGFICGSSVALFLSVSFLPSLQPAKSEGPPSRAARGPSDSSASGCVFSEGFTFESKQQSYILSREVRKNAKEAIRDKGTEVRETGLIAKGLIAEVHAAEVVPSGEKIALKRMKVSPSGSRRESNYLRELTLQDKCALLGFSPSVHGAWIENGTGYIAMELMDVEATEALHKMIETSFGAVPQEKGHSADLKTGDEKKGKDSRRVPIDLQKAIVGTYERLIEDGKIFQLDAKIRNLAVDRNGVLKVIDLGGSSQITSKDEGASVFWREEALVRMLGSFFYFQNEGASEKEEEQTAPPRGLTGEESDSPSGMPLIEEIMKSCAQQIASNATSASVPANVSKTAAYRFGSCKQWADVPIAAKIFSGSPRAK